MPPVGGRVVSFRVTVSGEQLARPCDDDVRVHVAHNDLDHVPRLVPSVEVAGEFATADADERLLGPCYAPTVSAVPERHLHQSPPRERRRVELGRPGFFDDDRALGIDRGVGEGRRTQHRRLCLEDCRPVKRRDHLVERGVIAPRPRVEVTPGVLDRARERAARVVRVAPQEHVFKEVGHTRERRGFVRGAGADPQIEGHHRRDAHLFHKEGHSVREKLTPDHCAFR